MYKNSLSINWKVVGFIFLLFLALELLSFYSFLNPPAKNIITIIVAIIFLLVAYFNISLALLAAAAELFIGSQGYLLSFTVGGANISLRIIIWLIIISLSIVDYFRRSDFYKDKLRNKHHLFFIGGILTLLVWGSIMALFNGVSYVNLFFDANNWLFFLLFFPLLALSSDFIGKLWQVIAAGSLWLFAKTTFLLYFFSHNFFTQPLIYKWMRDFRFGEITYVSGNFWRIFMQNQIFALLAAVFLIVYLWQKRARVKETAGLWLLLFFNITTVIISYSRSFWLAGVLTLFIWFVYVIAKGRFKFVELLRFNFILLVVLLFSWLLVLLTVNFPWPYVKPQVGGIVTERIASTTKSEPAGGSRLALLGPLWQGIKQNWLAGNGLGVTVTYFSRDPRIVSTTAGGSGVYTTYAFEWGWLALWFKFGLAGLLLFIYLLSKIFIMGWKKGGVFRASAVSLLALILVHFTTPYLDHPLGIAVILFNQLLMFYED